MTNLLGWGLNFVVFGIWTDYCIVEHEILQIYANTLCTGIYYRRQKEQTKAGDDSVRPDPTTIQNNDYCEETVPIEASKPTLIILNNVIANNQSESGNQQVNIQVTSHENQQEDNQNPDSTSQPPKQPYLYDEITEHTRPSATKQDTSLAGMYDEVHHGTSPTDIDNDIVHSNRSVTSNITTNPGSTEPEYNELDQIIQSTESPATETDIATATEDRTTKVSADPVPNADTDLFPDPKAVYNLPNKQTSVAGRNSGTLLGANQFPDPHAEPDQVSDPNAIYSLPNKQKAAADRNSETLLIENTLYASHE